MTPPAERISTSASRVALRGPSQVVAVLVAAASIAAGAGLIAWDHYATPAVDQESLVALVVDGPEGRLFEGDLRAATPLGALLVASGAGVFPVDVAAYPNGAYVRSIAGHEASGECGWLYGVNGEHLMVAADRAALAEGDRVRWYWGCAAEAA